MMPADDEEYTLADWAVAYALRGWEVFPVDPETKAPLTVHGMKDATVDTDAIAGWWTRWPGALIGHRIPRDVVILDIDPRHGGDATWRELTDSYGPHSAQCVHYSGRGDDGHHQWYKRPEGKISARGLHEFARERGTGHAAGKRSWTSGIDVLHHDHRYTILPPSPHPATGQPYYWQVANDPAPMPAWLAHYLTTAPQPPAPPRSTALRVADSDSIADWFSATHSWVDILGVAGWVLVSGDGDRDGSQWRHPNATAHTSATVRHGCLFVYSDNTDFEPTEQGDPNGYTRFRAWATLEHDADLKAAALAARELRDGPNWRSDPFTAVRTQNAGQSGASSLNLPAEFWTARPALEHIRRAAHARSRSADAVLGCVLARIAAYTPPCWRLPAIVGATSSIATYVALVGPSGAGKSSAKAVAMDLLRCELATVADDLPLGSGEGLMECYYDLVDEERPSGKGTVKVKRKVRHGAFMTLDEGQALADLGARKGSTLVATLRSAWTGGTLGTTNASVETKRLVPAGSYNLGLVIGLQPTLASALLDDAGGGLPQRFAWVSVTDPTIPDKRTPWPGPLAWTPPPIIRHGPGLTVDDEIDDEVRTNDLARQRGEVVADPLDAHHDLVRLKVAACFAIIDGRTHIDGDDWGLSGTFMTTSRLVRSVVAEELNIAARKAEDAATARLVRREAAVADSATTRAVEAMARAIAKAVGKHAGSEGVTPGKVKTYPAYKDRQAAPVDDAVELAQKLRWITFRDGRFHPGEAAPK